MVSDLGYPGVKTISSYFRNSVEIEMYGMVGPPLKTSDGKLTYSLDTSGGQCGGPVSNILTERTAKYTAPMEFKGAIDYNILTVGEVCLDLYVSKHDIFIKCFVFIQSTKH
jgi:hypothetical protein